MKRLTALLLAAALLLCSCSSAPKPKPDSPKAPVQLIYYTIGSPDTDLELVNKALNELLLERYGFTVSYRKIGWNDYLSQLNGMINTNQYFDIAFTWGDHYLENAKNGVFLNLTPMLRGKNLPLYQAVNPLFWKGNTVDSQICGVPTNKELATPVQLLFSTELAEKYGIDVQQYTTLSSLEPVLEMIAEMEPDCIPLFLDSSRTDLLTVLGYEYVINNQVPLVIRIDDPQCRILNVYEEEDCRQLLQTLYQYYHAGYINADAPLRTGFSRFEDEQVFCRLGCGGPESSASFSTDFGYPITAVRISDPLVTSTSTQGGIMAVNSKTDHPLEAMTFLEAINTDPDVRNLLNYGIEDVHYTLTEEDQVRLISGHYRAAPYTQGNWFILKTMEGENPDKWDHYRSFNNKVTSSRLLGFSPDLSKSQDIFNEIAKICNKYDTALLTGSAYPGIYVRRLCRELDQVGIQKLIQDLQFQTDDWLESQK